MYACINKGCVILSFCHGLDGFTGVENTSVGHKIIVKEQHTVPAMRHSGAFSMASMQVLWCHQWRQSAWMQGINRVGQDLPPFAILYNHIDIIAVVDEK